MRSLPLPSTPPPADEPARLPYAQASFLERQQALLAARQLLGPAFPHLADAAWVAAFDQVQPPLLRLPEGTGGVLAPEGLAALVSHLATDAAPPAAGPPPPVPPPAPSPKALPTKKQTYLMELTVIEQLNNAYYWLRRPVASVVNEALAQWLARCPEARQPRPSRAAGPVSRFRNPPSADQ